MVNYKIIIILSHYTPVEESFVVNSRKELKLKLQIIWQIRVIETPIWSRLEDDQWVSKSHDRVNHVTIILFNIKTLFLFSLMMIIYAHS